MTNNNDKLNIGQKYLIWENHLLFGHIPGLKPISRNTNRFYRRHPKYATLMFIMTMAQYSKWAIALYKWLTKPRPTADDISYLEDYKVQAYEDTYVIVSDPEQQD